MQHGNQHHTGGASLLRQDALRIFDSGNQDADMRWALGGDKPKFSQMAPESIYYLGLLTNKEIPDLECVRRCLLRSALYGDKSHCRPQGGFANRFSIGRIILLPLDEAADRFEECERARGMASDVLDEAHHQGLVIRGLDHLGGTRAHNVGVASRSVGGCLRYKV